MSSEVLVKRDLSKALKSKYIDIPAMPVTINLEMDKELQKLAKSGKEGFRLQQLTDVATDSLDKWADSFQKSINVVDKKLPDLSAGDIKKEMDELNELLEKMLKPLESIVEKDVDNAWKKIVAKNSELKYYNLGLAAKTTFAVLCAGANITSMVATAGADVLSALSLVYTAANLAAQFHRECMDMFQQHERLADMMQKLDDTVNDDLKGFADIVKGAEADASPVLGRFLTSTRSAETEIKSLRQKYTAADNDDDKTVGKINAALDKVSKIEKAGIADKAYAEVQDLEKQVDEMLKGMIVMRKVLDEGLAQLDDWSATIKAWNERNPAKAKLKMASTGVKWATTGAHVCTSIIKTVAAVKALV